ncbi:MAG: hypothetical protein IKK43_05335 [Clostridia bacterium]|nr:hypothetical protein [Clostridia bacterium]
MLILIFIILPFITLGKISYATSNNPSEELASWLENIELIPTREKFYEFSYKDDTKTYNAVFMKIVLPIEKTDYPRIIYKYSASGSITFFMQTYNEETSEVEENQIKLNLYTKYDDENGVEQTRSLLKRQAANNFNAGESKYGYLLEVAGNLSEYEKKPMFFKASIDIGSESVEETVQILNEKWLVSSTFSEISQNSMEENGWTAFWRWLTDTLNKVKDLIESLVNKLFIALADGILSVVCSAVGEPVTMDKVIFGRVGKLSINFWEDTAVGTNTNTEQANSVMSIMKPVVNDWYSVFFAIAVVVYMVALLIVGIKIVFSSTGDKKAKYKDVLQAWLSGVVILCLFPYVMKYTLLLNNLLVEMINTDLESVQIQEPEATPEIDQTTLDNASASFGEADFVNSIKGKPFEPSDAAAKRDMMLYIRELAANLGKMSLTFVYYVMLGELIVIIFVYYKRVFMMGFLITIFPIIAIMYIVEKLISGSSRAFSTWLKEYVVLVFTQAFHAAVYVVVVNAGVQVYIEQDNWLFMLLCVIFLFQGEKILRSIFGMKSSANTIGDLAKAGAAGYAVLGTAKKLFAGDKGENDEDKQIKEADEKAASGSRPQTTSSSGGGNSGNSNGSGGGSGDAGNTEQEEGPRTEPEEITNDPNAAFARAQSVVIGQALRQRQKTRKGRGVAGKIGKAVGHVGSAVGATVGLAAGLATGDVGKAVGFAVAGKAVGKTVTGVVRAPIKGISNLYRGHRLKQKIMSGDLDKEFRDAGLDMASLDTETQEMFRKALAELGGRSTTRGKRAGELRMLKQIADIRKNNNNN